MAKKNNKGFSLVEIIIAIAILTLLLAPVMRQFTATMRTSRKAKETQYANEDAVYVLGYFQKDNIQNIIENKPVVDIKSNFTSTAPVEKKVKCELFGTDGKSLTTEIEYTAKIYTLDNTKVGPRQIEYKRTVILDDLASKLKAADEKNDIGYQISYNMTSADLAAFPTGFELTNEGSIVKYDADHNNVIAAACETTTYVTDPNEANLGNIQDLDKSKVAIIDMDASGFDAEVERDFYAIFMERLRDVDEDSWRQALLHNDKASILDQRHYLETITKVTKIYVEEFEKQNDDIEDEDEDGEKVMYYVINVDVVYNNNYSFEDKVGKKYSYTDQLEYNAFSQPFYTSRCPDIYMEYQPYVLSSTKTSVNYASNDYILIDNCVKDAKLYLYKPYEDQMTKIYGTDNIVGDSKTGYLYYDKNIKDTTAKVVTINICNVSAKTEDMQIYTNLKCEIDDTTKVFKDKQFKVDKFGVLPEVLTSAKNAKYSSTSAGDRTAFKPELIKSVFADKRVEERLYTVTVKLEPTTDFGYNTITLTGAKGAN